MLVPLEDVRTKFDQLITGALSREEVANWAHGVRSSDDVEPLTYEPIDLSSIIWQALIYLEGVDLRESPYEYLHTVDDFKRKRLYLGL